MDAASFSQPQQAHLVGIAGNGMRALADVLLGWGWRLSGSDLDVGPVQTLRAAGVLLFAGHAADHVPAVAELLVYSDAVRAENPELGRAAELGIPALSYFQMLGRLGVGCRTVAVAGTHGKSSTAAMLAHLLTEAGRDPTVVYGATPVGATSGGRAGRSELMLVEACEYRANFLHLRPQQAAILGIEPDHFDCYDSLASLEEAFRRFAESVANDGLLVARHGCESTRRVTSGLKCRIETIGLSADADWSAHPGSAGVPPANKDAGGTTVQRSLLACDGSGVDCRLSLRESGATFAERKATIAACGRPAGGTPALPGETRQSHFEIRRFGCRLCDVVLSQPGEHNVLNALAAAALAFENGVSGQQISAGLATFPGLHRRLERLGAWRGVELIDDYAHHPSEMTAALTTVRQMFPRARVWCVFQPHQASRTARLLDELAMSLQNADRVMVAEIFRAREGDPQPGEVTAADLARRAAELGADVLPGHTDREIAETLEVQLAPGDVLVTLGAGDVAKLQPRNRE